MLSDHRWETTTRTRFILWSQFFLLYPTAWCLRFLLYHKISSVTDWLVIVVLLMGNGKPLQTKPTGYAKPCHCHAPNSTTPLGSSQAVMVFLNVSFWYQVVLILPLGVAMGWFNMIVCVSVLSGYLGPKMTWHFNTFQTSQDGEIYVKYSRIYNVVIMFFSGSVTLGDCLFNHVHLVLSTLTGAGMPKIQPSNMS